MIGPHADICWQPGGGQNLALYNELIGCRYQSEICKSAVNFDMRHSRVKQGGRNLLDDSQRQTATCFIQHLLKRGHPIHHEVPAS